MRSFFRGSRVRNPADFSFGRNSSLYSTRRAGNAVADRARLAGSAAALDRHGDVEVLRRLGEEQRLLDDHLKNFVGEVDVQRTPVHFDLTRPGTHEDSRGGGLAPAGTVILQFAQSSLLVLFRAFDVENGRALRLVGVIRTGVDLQLAVQLATQTDYGAACP